MSRNQPPDQAGWFGSDDNALPEEYSPPRSLEAVSDIDPQKPALLPDFNRPWEWSLISPPSRSQIAAEHLRPWNSASPSRDVLITLLSYSLIIASVLGLLTLSGSGRSGSTGDLSLPALPLQVNIIFSILAFFLLGGLEAMIAVVPLILVLWIYRSGWRSLAWRIPVPGSHPILLLALGLLLGYGSEQLYTLVLPWLHTYAHIPETSNIDPVIKLYQSSPALALSFLLVGVLIAPPVEELFFRGFLMRGLRSKIGTGWAVLLSAVVFSAFHGDVGSAILIFVFGLILGYLAAHTESLWPSIILHAINNVRALIVVVLAAHGIHG